ncbi:MAG: HAD family hydrolase [Synergistaceae bacterium]|nr:HAD family hydrolase [Synergistaceae bacterium]
MKYRAIISDFDGTLYYQFPVRILMALWLIIYYVIFPLRIKELFFLREFRRLQEKHFGANTENFYHSQIDRASRLYNLNPDKAESIINLWMIMRPLRIIKLFRRRRLLASLKSCQESGIKIIIYSDNPVKEKISAINFTPDYSFWSCDEIIKCMKPDSSGLRNIINLLGLPENQVLYIGDRYDRDGLCAKSAGINYIDVKNLDYKTFICNTARK